MDHFAWHVSPEMHLATLKTHLKHVLAALATRSRAYEADTATLFRLCAHLPDAQQATLREQVDTIQQSLEAAHERHRTACVETLAHLYRALPSHQQEVFLDDLRSVNRSLVGREGKEWFDEIVARLQMRLEDA